jgi:hypothetical protein
LGLAAPARRIGTPVSMGRLAVRSGRCDMNGQEGAMKID